LDVQELVGHLAAWGVAASALVVDPLLPPHADYFTGALWQLHLLQPATGSTSLLAVGASTNVTNAACWKCRTLRRMCCMFEGA